MGDELFDTGFVELDDFRNKQDLSRHAFSGDRIFEAFVDDALVSGMLIDEDEPIAGLRHNVSRVDLRPRGAERMIDLLAIPGLVARALGSTVELVTKVCGGRAPLQLRLRPPGQAAAHWRKSRPHPAPPPPPTPPPPPP